MFAGEHDPNKPYYSVIQSSSEGELTDEEEKSDVMSKVLPPASNEDEKELRRKLLKARKAKEDQEEIEAKRIKHEDHHRKSPKGSRHSKDDRHKSRHRSKSPPSKKRPAIKAPTPEQKNDDNDIKSRHHDSKSKHNHVDKDELAEKVTKIVVEEKQKIEIQRISADSTPSFSNSPSPKNNSPMNLQIKALIGQQLNRSNTSSPMPGTKKYSRFDSPEPESGGEDEIPKVVEMHVSSESDGDLDKTLEDEEMIDENVLVALSKKFEDLDDEEKKLLTLEKLRQKEEEYQKRLIAKLPVYYPGIYGCRSINEFKLLNRISEGTFGVVFRAMEKNTDEMVALKQLKMEKEKEGFPITSLREINMLMKCRKHPNVVGLKEIVTDATGEKIYMVMEFVEHDLRALMKQLEGRGKRFKLAEVKTLMQQLLSGIAYMHDEWVIHRDLKTANLLLSHKNILKIGDFGLAREYGDPLKPYTSLVVTLHYRSPELLLGCKKYSTAVDMWSVGCIFGEFFRLNAIFPATSEGDQVKMIFEGVGTPNEKIWPGYNELPFVAKCNWPNHPPGQLRKRFFKYLNESEEGLDLLTRLLTTCPEYRISAEEALKHEWFSESPLPAPPESFPTWPAKSENLQNPPKQVGQPKPHHQQPQPSNIDPERLKLLQEFNIKPTKSVANAGFSLKLGR